MCLPQAVLALESAAEIERAALSPKLAPEEWDAEAGCLGAALSDVLPPFAFRYLVGLVTARLAELSTEPGGLVSTRRESGRDGAEQWLSLDVWADSGNEEGLIDGGWFAPWLEERYQQQLADARQHREEEALRRAEAERKMAEWEAHREEERRTEAREAEEAPRGNERPLERRTEPVDAPVETKAQIQARADEQRNRELLLQRERDLAKGMLEAEKWRKARQQREEKDDERRREEEEVERKRAAWELKRRAKESPARIQRAGVRVEFGDPRAR
jgi:hypothetical protein